MIKSIFGYIFKKRQNSPSVAIVKAKRVEYPKYLNDLVCIAKNNGWRVKSYLDQNKSMVFIPKEPSPNKNIVIYTTTMTVSTTMKNVTHGRQLYRKNVRMADMNRIFENPRVSGTGFYVNHKR